MCNLYRLTKPTTAVADLFRVQALPGANYGAEVYPGYSGLVVEGDTARAMTWGFPLVLKGKHGQPLKPKPVNNTRTDKLHTAFWRSAFERRRCLIPVTQWAEAKGEPGQMTRTWYSLHGSDLFAVAGIWRPTAEWGDAYSMVMVDGCAQMADVHDRMPVILSEASWRTWTDGDATEAFALCQTCPDPLGIDRSEVPWATKRQSQTGADKGPALL